MLGLPNTASLNTHTNILLNTPQCLALNTQAHNRPGNSEQATSAAEPTTSTPLEKAGRLHYGTHLMQLYIFKEKLRGCVTVACLNCTRTVTIIQLQRKKAFWFSKWTPSAIKNRSPEKNKRWAIIWQPNLIPPLREKCTLLWSRCNLHVIGLLNAHLLIYVKWGILTEVRKSVIGYWTLPIIH